MINTEDKGWYERTNDRVSSRTPGYNLFCDYNSYMAILGTGYTLAVLWLFIALTDIYKYMHTNATTVGMVRKV